MLKYNEEISHILYQDISSYFEFLLQQSWQLYFRQRIEIIIMEDWFKSLASSTKQTSESTINNNVPDINIEGLSTIETVI
jgi:hypothetical protein